MGCLLAKHACGNVSSLWQLVIAWHTKLTELQLMEPSVPLGALHASCTLLQAITSPLKVPHSKKSACALYRAVRGSMVCLRAGAEPIRSTIRKQRRSWSPMLAKSIHSALKAAIVKAQLRYPQLTWAFYCVDCIWVVVALLEKAMTRAC